jgi:(p)ppGpp synthase/HD superfamily hydrolase
MSQTRDAFTVRRAREFAVHRHGAQRYGDRPYASHLDEVAELVRPFGDQAMVVAYLHDVIEDTETSAAEIEQEFGPLVARCVALITDEPAPDRARRKVLTHAKLAACPEQCLVSLVVKAADRLANLRACTRNGRQTLLRMYQREHAAFRRAVFRPGLCDVLWGEIDELVVLTD